MSPNAGLLKTLLPKAAAVLLVVAALVVGWWWLERYQETQAEAQRMAFEESARGIANTIASSFHPYRIALKKVAATDAARRAVAAPRKAAPALAAMAEELPPHLVLRALPPDPDVGFDEREPPLSYASIDHMRAATRDSEAIPIEYYRTEDGGGYVVVIERVLAEDGSVVGFLHVSADAERIRNELSKVAPPGTYVEILQQTEGDRPLTIVKSGTVAARGGQSARAAVPGTIWQAEVRAAGEPEGAGGTRLPLIAAAGALALAGVTYGAIRRRRGAGGMAKKDEITVQYHGAIRSIFDGEHPGMEALVTEREVDTERFKPPAPEESAATTPMEEGEVFDIAGAGEPAVEEESFKVHPSVFRTYDIRGIVGTTLDEDAIYLIGRALGAEAAHLDQKTVVVARDGRNSSEAFAEALTRGLTESGRDVLDIGLTPSPVLYFATHYLDARSGVMITGSHNPGNYNGLKIVLAGKTLSGEAIQAIKRRIEDEDFVSGQGKVQQAEIIPDYIRRISEEIPVSLGASLKIIVDCGNGVPGIVAPHLFRAIGHDVEELYCDVDGDFPNHHPDPSQPENLEDLITVVRAQQADLGLAFDGDGDRLGVVDGEGNIIWPDRQMILFARDVLSRQQGAPIIFDVKCTGRLADAIREAGGEPVMYKTGHSLIKAKMQEISAPLAGEMSGHIFFKERWYGFDDALYAACRLLEILVNAGRPASEVFAELPSGVATPELRLDMSEERHAAFMEEVLAAADFADATVSTIDGLRVDFADAWGLIRPSNTTPCLVLRFEGDDQKALGRVQERFRELLLGIDESLDLPF